MPDEVDGSITLALMSGLRHSSNIPIEGHFSAQGMPNRPCDMPVRTVLRGDDTRTRPRSPSRCPLGIGVLFRRSGPALSTGPVSFVEVAAGPRRVEGCWEMRRGPTPGRSFPENQHQPRGNKATVRVCCRSASRHVRQRMLAACPPCNTRSAPRAPSAR